MPRYVYLAPLQQQEQNECINIYTGIKPTGRSGPVVTCGRIWAPRESVVG